MKTLLFILLLFLVSCEKNREYNFSCDITLHYTSLDGSMSFERFFPDRALDNKTYDEKNRYVANAKQKRLVPLCGVPWIMYAEINAIPYYCPEY
jgi:hypothetical protein